METPRVVRAALAALVGSWFCAAATFPLPFPVRPTSFPLKRPTITGTVVAWGSGGAALPQSGLKSVVAIAAGENHTVALRSDGSVVAWGDNLYGQTTVPVAAQTDVVRIAAGESCTVALKSDGTLVAWGWNQFGQTTVPPGLKDVVSISAGSGFTVALKSDGTVVAWGYNSAGQTNVPNDLKDVVAIAAGVWSSGAVVETGAIDGRVFTWGDLLPNFPVPGGLSGVVAISVGGRESVPRILALKSDGTVIGWGSVEIGSIPAFAQSDAVAIAAGRQHSLALKADSTVVAWGSNNNGQTSVPVGLRNVVAIAAGYYHSVALVSDGLSLPPGATARAQVVNGFVVGLDVLNGGRGYAVPPLVVIRGGGGTGATATAILSDGAVVGFKITNPGSDYTSAPTVLVASPPFTPQVSVAVSRISVAMQVVLGKTYQLQASSDSSNWATVGAPFVADSELLTQEFSVSDTGRFFRVVEVQ